jgi:hypothetical protein
LGEELKRLKWLKRLGVKVVKVRIAYGGGKSQNEKYCNLHFN